MLSLVSLQESSPRADVHPWKPAGAAWKVGARGAPLRISLVWAPQVLQLQEPLALWGGQA